MVKYGEDLLDLKFVWDLIKENSNLSKHGVSFHEAIETFYDLLGFSVEDKRHSLIEQRYLWVGRSKKDRILTTRYTFRGETIRIFGSAEWREFRMQYYEKTKIK